MQKNLSLLNKQKKISESLSKAYDELLLLEEKVRNPVEIYKKDDVLDKETIDAYKDAKGVPLTEFDFNTIAMVLKAKNQKSMEEVNFLIGEAKEFVERFEKGKKYDFYRVDDIFVDLTAVINELKAFDNIDTDKLKKAEEVRKALRYVVTARSNANKMMKEISKKRDEAKAKLESKEFESELEKLQQKHEQEMAQLRQKYEVPEDFEDNMDKYFDKDDLEELEKLQQMKAKYETNASRAENEAKELVIYIRDLLKEFYEIPEKVIDEVNITLKAMGAVASVVRKYSDPNIKKADLKKALENPKIKELLEPYITEGYYFESVNIINSKIPEVSKFFGEAHNKIAKIIEDIPDTEEVKKTDISEGVLKDAFKKGVNLVVSAISKMSDRLKSAITSLKNSVFRNGTEIETAITSFNSEHSKRLKKVQNLYLDIESDMSELSIELLRENIKK